MSVMGTNNAIVFSVVVIGLAIFAVVRVGPHRCRRRGRASRTVRPYHRTLHAGLNLMMPFIDRLRHSLTCATGGQLPPQPVITGTTWCRHRHGHLLPGDRPKARRTRFANYVAAVEQLTVTTLRNVVGGMDLERP